MKNSKELTCINQPGGLTIHSSYNQLTKGQEEMLNYMKECVKESKPMEMDKITKIYRDCVMQHSDQRWHGYDGKLQVWVKTESFIKEQAKVWFKLNLGALILKEKLIVIPVINVK